MAKCSATACADTGAKVTACLMAHSCQDLSSAYCADMCRDVYIDLNHCFEAAAADPSDVGGCYSGSHKCWTLPICHDDGSATK